MVPSKNITLPSSGLDWRAEAQWLRDQLAAGGGPDTAAHEARLSRIDAALAEPERSRLGELPDLELAQRTIEAMKAGEGISPEGIKAIVASAELGIESVREFDLRWQADMRAIARWQAAEHGRELIWPDHADLVVWLMSVIEARPADTIASLTELRERLSRAIVSSGGNQLAVDAKRTLDAMGSAIIAADRQLFMRDEDRRQLRWLIEGAIALLDELAGVFREYERHHRERADEFDRYVPIGAPPTSAARASIEKAERNADLALRIGLAAARLRQACSQPIIETPIGVVS
jgi:hypothetical protein